MREYDFNKFGVCINPECFTFKCDQGDFKVETAFLNGFWYNGHSINLPTEGLGIPCSNSGTPFKSEQQATNDACTRIKKWLIRREKNEQANP